MKILLSAITVVIATATSSLAMTPSELAKFASNYRSKENEPVVYMVQNTACAEPLPVTLVKTINLGGGRIGGVTQYWDCPVATFTYFEMTRGKYDSISIFAEVSAGRTSNFSNWSPNPDSNEESMTFQELEAIARAIDKYTR